MRARRARRLGDLLYAQRIMTQRIFERVRRIELQLGVAPSHYEPGQHTEPRRHDRRRAGGATGKTEEREALRL